MSEFRADTELCAWDATESRDVTTVFAPSDEAARATADVAAVAFSRKSSSSSAAPTPRVAPRAAAAADPDDEEDDAEITPSPQECGMTRKEARAKCKGTNIYFTAASPRDVVLMNAVESGYSVVHKIEKADVMWIEAQPYSVEFVRGLTYERINFLPGMKVACSKCCFSRLIKRVAAMYPDDFPFIPRTFSLPDERAELTKYVETFGKQIFVVKPDGGCGGDGIYLTNDVTSIRHAECVVQEYVANPLLNNGLKFDLRLYVAITSVNPLRFYVHREGLARMAVQPYEAPAKSNFHKLNMHLTNYSLNKFSSEFVPNTDAENDELCSKRRATTAFRQLRAQYPEFDEEAMWADVDDLVGRTLAAVMPQVFAATGEIPGETNYLSRCFHLIGFDVLLDDAFKPHLLEINNHPSLLTDAPIDMAVKTQVVRPLVRMVAYDAHKYRIATRKNREFVPPSVAERAEWEAKCAEGSGFVAGDAHESARLVNQYAAPLLPLMRVFIGACSAARGKYDEMTATRFIRLMRKLGFAGPGCAFQTADMDLMFIKVTSRLGTNSLSFFTFLDLLVDVVGDKIAPATPRSSADRLHAMTRLVLEAEASAAAA